MIVPPSEFICPITKELMSEPMVTRYGIRFERQAIMEWMIDQGNGFCPVTGNPLRVSNLLSDKNLQWKIQDWAKRNKIKLISVGTHDSKIIMATAAIPDDRFLCPLTKDIMREPMMSRHGHSFEKSAILSRLQENAFVCPLSGKRLRPSDLVSNHKLQWEIQQWQLQYGEAYDEKTQREMNLKLVEVSKIPQQGRQTVDIINVLAEDGGRDDVSESSSLESSDPNVLLCLDQVIRTIE